MVAGSRAERDQRGRGDRGAAVVEFALIAVLLFTLIFAIIVFGVLLSFRQDLTRAAAEGARAGAVAVPAADVELDTIAATNEAVDQAGQTCGLDGMACDIDVRDCDEDPPPTPSGSNEPDTPDCAFVELVFDYGNHPFMPQIPLIDGFLPDTIEADSVARIND